MRANGGDGESNGGGDGAGDRPFGDRTAASLEVLGIAVAMLNHRLDAAEGVASATADANVEAFRTVEERLAAQERRTGELEAALIALGKAAGLSPVWSDERGNRATH